MEFQTYEVSIWNGNKKIPYWNMDFLHGFLSLSSFMFVYVANSIQYHLLFLTNHIWYKLAKFEQNGMVLTTQNLYLFYKSLYIMFTISEYR